MMQNTYDNNNSSTNVPNLHQPGNFQRFFKECSGKCIHHRNLNIHTVQHSLLQYGHIEALVNY